MHRLNKKTIVQSLFWFVGLICLFFILYLRFLEGITRSYGQDEIYHLHFVYLLSQGKIPFKDFVTIYSPLFHLTLLPIFKVIGESFTVFTLSRVVIFFYNIFLLIFIFWIGVLVGNIRSAFVALVVAAALPMAIERAIEIRPDNLMTVLILAGVFFFIKGIKDPKKINFFLSGFFFAISFLVLIKSVVTIIAFLLGVFLLFVFEKKQRKNLISGSVYFIIGATIPMFLFIVALLVLDILPNAYDWMFILSRRALTTFRFGTFQNPLFWWTPIDSIYGAFKNFAWYLNNTLFFIGGIGIIGLILTKEKGLSLKWLLFYPMIFSLLYLFTVKNPFHQYLLPFLIFVPFWVGWGVEFALSVLSKRAIPLTVFLLRRLKIHIRIEPDFRYLDIVQTVTVSMQVILFIVLAFSVWDSRQTKKHWDDRNERNFINFVLIQTKKEDIFWGGVGNYVFRLDGYCVYSYALFELPSDIRRRLPPFIQSLEEHKTKYMLVDEKSLHSKTWPYDEKDQEPFVDYVLTKFQPSGYPGI